MGKRGAILDMFLIVVLIMVIASTAIIALHLWNTMYAELYPEMPAVSQDALDTVDSFLQGYDYIIIFFVVGFIIAAILSAFVIDTYPAFFFLSILMLIILIVVSAMFSNVWEGFTNTTVLATEVNTLSKTDTLIRNLPIIMTPLTGLLLIVLYMKTRGARGV